MNKTGNRTQALFAEGVGILIIEKFDRIRDALSPDRVARFAYQGKIVWGYAERIT
jgi:Fe-S cluster assembly ATPase SufC